MLRSTLLTEKNKVINFFISMFEYFIALKAFHTVTCVQNQVEHVLGLRILHYFVHLLVFSVLIFSYSVDIWVIVTN